MPNYRNSTLGALIAATATTPTHVEQLTLVFSGPPCRFCGLHAGFFCEYGVALIMNGQSLGSEANQPNVNMKVLRLLESKFLIFGSYRYKYCLPSYHQFLVGRVCCVFL